MTVVDNAAPAFDYLVEVLVPAPAHTDTGADLAFYAEFPTAAAAVTWAVRQIGRTVRDAIADLGTPAIGAASCVLDERVTGYEVTRVPADALAVDTTWRITGRPSPTMSAAFATVGIAA